MHIASAINPLDKSDGNVPVSVFCYNNQRRFLFVSQSYEACCIINRTFTLSLTHDVGNYWASGKRLPDSKPKFHSPSNVVPTFLSRTKCYHRSKRLPVLMAFHWRDWGGNNRRFCYWRYVWIFRVYHLETYIYRYRRPANWKGSHCRCQTVHPFAFKSAWSPSLSRHFERGTGSVFNTIVSKRSRKRFSGNGEESWSIVPVGQWKPARREVIFARWGEFSFLES